MGPSIYDVHTEGIRLRWMHADGWTSSQKIRAHSCLSLMQRSWHILYQNFVFGRIKKWIYRQYKLVIDITNSTALSKTQSYYSWISALGPEGLCFKRAMCISCRLHVGSISCRRMWIGGLGPKTRFSCGCHKWIVKYHPVIMSSDNFYSIVIMYVSEPASSGSTYSALCFLLTNNISLLICDTGAQNPSLFVFVFYI